MRTDIDVLVEIPCFKCLLWNPIKESHLHCNPNDCEELTEWLLKQTEGEQTKEELIVASIPTARTKKASAKQT